jgi:hypothetical protein
VFSVVAHWRLKEKFLRPHHNWFKEMIGLCHKQQIVLYKQFGVIWLWQEMFYRLIQGFFSRVDGRAFELVTPLMRTNWTDDIKARVKRLGEAASAEQKRIKRQIRKSRICLTHYDSPRDPTMVHDSTMESYTRDIISAASSSAATSADPVQPPKKKRRKSRLCGGCNSFVYDHNKRSCPVGGYY